MTLQPPTENPSLAVRARDGDVDALALLVENHRPWIERVAGLFMRDPDLVQDIMQDAFIEARRSVRNLREPEKFGAWYCGIVLNLCRNRLARETPYTLSLEAMPGGLRFEVIDFAHTERDPAEVAAEREAFSRLVEAVVDLPEAYRTATTLFYLRQLSAREVASVLGISVGAVKVRLHRAREQLRRHVLTSPVGSGFKPDRSQSERSRPMTRVNIVDVVNRSVARQGDSPPAQFSVVVLADESNNRALPIWIGRGEGVAIALGVRRRVTPRPLTFATFAEVLRAAGTEIVEVEISRLEGDTFRATIGLNTQTGTKRVDARPSDALAIAVQFDAPIYVADEVLAQAGIDVDGAEMEDRDGKSLDSIVAEIEDPARWRGIVSSPEDRERACRELINEVFGGELV